MAARGEYEQSPYLQPPAAKSHRKLFRSDVGQYNGMAQWYTLRQQRGCLYGNTDAHAGSGVECRAALWQLYVQSYPFSQPLQFPSQQSIGNGENYFTTKSVRHRREHPV